MAIDFSQVKEVKYNNQDVIQINQGSTVLWKKSSEYLDLSQFSISLTKGTPASSSGVAGKGYGDINRDTIIAELKFYNQTTLENLKKYWKTAPQSATTRPDIGIFYTIASTTELNYNNVTTGTTAVNLEWIINNYDNLHSTYEFTLTRTAGSSSYPYRAVSIGTTSGVYYGDKTSGSASAVKLQYSVYYNTDENEWLFGLYDVDHAIQLITIGVKLKEA